MEDDLTDYKNIKIENKKIYIRKEYLEEASIVRIFIDLVKALERHFETLGLFEKRKTPSSNNLKFNRDNDVAIDDTDGNKDEEKSSGRIKYKLKLPNMSNLIALSTLYEVSIDEILLSDEQDFYLIVKCVAFVTML